MKQFWTCIILLLSFSSMQGQVIRELDWTQFSPGFVSQSDFQSVNPDFYATRGFNNGPEVGVNGAWNLEIVDDPFGAGSGRFAKVWSREWVPSGPNTFGKALRAATLDNYQNFSESEVWIDFPFRVDDNWITHKEGKMGFSISNKNGNPGGNNPTEDFEFIMEYYSPGTPKTHHPNAPWKSINPSGPFTEQDLLIGLNAYCSEPYMNNLPYSEPIFLKESVNSNIRKVFHKDINYTIRVHIKLNTPGLSDGILEGWFSDDNGVSWTKGMELLSFNWRGNSTHEFTRESMAAFRGGSGAGWEVGGGTPTSSSQNTGVQNPAQDTWYYLGHIKIYGSSPFTGTPPTAVCSATPTSGNAPLAVSFDGSASSDPDGTIVSYAWNFGDGITGSGASPSHTYNTTGTYTAVLTLTDDDGFTSSCSQTITVGNQAPNADCSATPLSGNAPLQVNFDGSASSDPDGSIAAYSWDFGDGSSAAGATPSHTYQAAGTYSATLSVTDNGGATDNCSLSITVNSGGGSGCNPVPSPWTNADIGNGSFLQGSACYDASVPEFEIQASGENINGTSDQFHYVYQSSSANDLTVTVKLMSLVNIHTYAKAGIMFRAGTDPGAAHHSILAIQGATSYQERSSANATTSSNWSGSAITHPVYLKLEKIGNTVTGYESQDGITWTQRGGGTSVLGSNFYIGLAVTSHNVTKLTTAKFQEVTISGGCTAPDVPTPVAMQSNICAGGSTDICVGSGDQLNDATAWHLYADNCSGTALASSSSGNFTVSPAVTTTYYVRGEGGCVSPGSCGSVTITVDPGFSVPFSYLATSFDVSDPDPTPYVPYQNGTCVSGSFSSSPVGLSLDPNTGVIDLSNSAPGQYVVSFTPNGNCATASTVTIDITGTPTGCYLPSPLQSTDIGAVGLAGQACYDASTDSYQIDASGADVWGTQDEFHYMYLDHTDEDVVIIAKLSSLDNTHTYAKAGLMIRESLAQNSIHASIVANQSETAFQYRLGNGASTDPATGSWLGSGISHPIYLKLEKTGNVVEGFESNDGVNWTSRGSTTISFTTPYYIGLMACSHDNAALTTAVFEEVSYYTPGGQNIQAPGSGQMPSQGAGTFSGLQKLQVQVFPNPNDGHFTLALSGQGSDDLYKPGLNKPVMELYATSGQLLKRMSLEKKQTQLDVSGLSAGLYQIRVIHGQEQRIQTLVIK